MMYCCNHGCITDALSFTMINCSAADSRGRTAFRTCSRLDPPSLRSDNALAVMIAPPNSSIQFKLVSVAHQINNKIEKLFKYDDFPRVLCTPMSRQLLQLL